MVVWSTSSSAFACASSASMMAWGRRRCRKLSKRGEKRSWGRGVTALSFLTWARSFITLGDVVRVIKKCAEGEWGGKTKWWSTSSSALAVASSALACPSLALACASLASAGACWAARANKTLIFVDLQALYLGCFGVCAFVCL